MIFEERCFSNFFRGKDCDENELIVLAVQDKQIRLNNLVPNGHMLPAVEVNGPEFLLNGWL